MAGGTCSSGEGQQPVEREGWAAETKADSVGQASTAGAAGSTASPLQVFIVRHAWSRAAGPEAQQGLASWPGGSKPVYLGQPVADPELPQRRQLAEGVGHRCRHHAAVARGERQGGEAGQLGSAAK